MTMAREELEQVIVTYRNGETVTFEPINGWIRVRQELQDDGSLKAKFEIHWFELYEKDEVHVDSSVAMD